MEGSRFRTIAGLFWRGCRALNKVLPGYNGEADGKEGRKLH